MDFKRAFFAAIAVIFLIEASPAFALDLSPLAVQAIDIVQLAAVTLGGVLVTFAVRWLSAATGVNNAQLEALLVSQANTILHRAIGFAHAAALAKINDPNNPMKHVEFDNVFIQMAANYAMRSMPDIIRKLGLTEERIRQLIIARLPDYINENTPVSTSDVVAAEANATRVVQVK